MERSTIVMQARSSHGRDSIVTTVPRAGDQLGGYRLCVQIARGGMSTVFLARAEGRAGLQHYVALKWLTPQLEEGSDFVNLMADEARIASRLQHPNLCSVIDFAFDASAGTGYLVMEYLQGHTLAEVRRQIDERPSDVAVVTHAGLAARIVADAAEGLHTAHELVDNHGRPLNVVHRDVSPDNVFLTYDGNVKVLDFGVALSSHQMHQTRPGVLKGKYSYLQPEVLGGHKADRRADIWGLGVVLWELLTGKRLFDFATDVEMLHAIAQMEIPRPSAVRSGIPTELDDIVLKALQRNPKDRYQTARELGRQLQLFLVQNRLVVGLAEMAELMDCLFPNGRACGRQRLATLDEMEGTAEEEVAADACATVARDVLIRGDKVAEARTALHPIRGKAPVASQPPSPDVAPAIAPPSRGEGAVWQRRALHITVSGVVAVALLLSAAWIGQRSATVNSVAAPAATPALPTASVQSGYRIELQPVGSSSDGDLLLRARVIDKRALEPSVSMSTNQY